MQGAHHDRYKILDRSARYTIAEISVALAPLQDSSELSESLRKFGGGVSSKIIKFVERDQRLPRQVDKCGREEAERHNKEDGNSAFVLDSKKRTHESDDHEQCGKYRAGRCIKYCPVQQNRSLLEAGKIGLQMRSRRIGTLNRV